MIGDQWVLVSIQYYKNGRRMGDGDTLNGILAQMRLLGHRRYLVQEMDFLGIRLVTVDTPEVGQFGHAQATRQLTEWVEKSMLEGPVLVYLYDSAGWDRILGDLVNASGESASEWLMRPVELGGCGWPAYEKK